MYLEAVWARIAGVNPLIWALLAMALIVNLGAKKWAGLFKVPPHRRAGAYIAIKCAALALALGACAALFLYH